MLNSIWLELKYWSYIVVGVDYVCCVWFHVIHVSCDCSMSLCVTPHDEPSRLTVDALEEAVALGTKPRQTDDVT